MDGTYRPTRFLPIIYVRGFALTKAEMNQTAADPFCGFNLGSTVYRAVPRKQDAPRKFVFESPVVRLMSGFDYRDVYEEGNDILDPDWERYANGERTPNRLRARSIIIHRYYDDCSELLGRGADPDMGSFARGLSALILRARDLMDANEKDGIPADQFKCYLVAHSMGGLICRGMLQNSENDPGNASRYVDKIFTYATPHNGIDIGGRNVPSWIDISDIGVFNKSRIAKLIDMEASCKHLGRSDLIKMRGRFDHRRFFCMVGTNRSDYEVAAGLSRTFVGHGSDGLVKIENATLTAIDEQGALEECAKAFAYRTHSGVFGIVNSEEAFQNLARFLFGDLRVDIHVSIDDIRLPDAVRRAEEAGQEVDALYQIEITAAPRGKLWYLTRRTIEEDSVACLAHRDWKNRKKIYLSSVFLSNKAKVVEGGPSLAYAMTMGIRVPDYEIQKKLWINEHYEGSYLFRNALLVEIFNPREGSGWQVRYGWQDSGVAQPNKSAAIQQLDDGSFEIAVAFDSVKADAVHPEVPTIPGVSGTIHLRVWPWNTEFDDDQERA